MPVVEIAVAVLAAAAESSTEIRVCAGAIEKLDSGRTVVVASDASVAAVAVTVGYGFGEVVDEAVDDDTVGVLVSKIVAAADLSFVAVDTQSDFGSCAVDILCW